RVSYRCRAHGCFGPATAANAIKIGQGRSRRKAMTVMTIDVSNEIELNQAIASADAATSGSFDIVFTLSITEGTDVGNSITFGAQTLSAPPDLYALNLASGVSVTIDGGGNTLDGAGAYRGFFVYAGN